MLVNRVESAVSVILLYDIYLHYVCNRDPLSWCSAKRWRLLLTGPESCTTIVISQPVIGHTVIRYCDFGPTTVIWYGDTNYYCSHETSVFEQGGDVMAPEHMTTTITIGHKVTWRQLSVIRIRLSVTRIQLLVRRIQFSNIRHLTNTVLRHTTPGYKDYVIGRLYYEGITMGHNACFWIFYINLFYLPLCILFSL